MPGPGAGPIHQAAQFVVLPALARALRLDVLHSPANVGPGLTPGVASAVSLMDLIWLHYAAEWNPDPRAQRSMRRWVEISLRHADAVLTISEAAQAEITADFGVTGQRLAVTPLGVRRSPAAAAPAEALRRRLTLGVDQRVLLCVAQKRPYKNLAVLVEALPGLPSDVVLVLPGTRTSYEDELLATAERLSVTDRLRHPDWVSDEELAALYEMAEVVALPSLTEGFGLPVLEAMTHGAPVACSDIPVLREVAGDAAAYFDPRDPGSVRRCLEQLLSDAPRRAELVRHGRTQAAGFTWEQTGAATLAGYRMAIANHYAGRR